MSDARDAVLSEIYRVLVADGTLAATLAGQGVFDGVPQGAAHPFVSFADVRSAALDADDVPAVEHRIEMIAYSRQGRREASSIADRVRAVLAGAALSPSGHRLVSLRHSQTDVTSSRDGRAFRARMRFRAVTEAN